MMIQGGVILLLKFCLLNQEGPHGLSIDKMAIFSLGNHKEPVVSVSILEIILVFGDEHIPVVTCNPLLLQIEGNDRWLQILRINQEDIFDIVTDILGDRNPVRDCVIDEEKLLVIGSIDIGMMRSILRNKSSILKDIS